MNSLFLVVLASGCAALSNLFFRKSSSKETQGSYSGFLLFNYILSFISSLFFFHEIWTTPPNVIVLVIGSLVGIFNVGLMFLTGQALKYGSSGLTFAFQNSSAVFPALLLFLFFGKDFGFSTSYIQLLGLGLVIFGLFCGTLSQSRQPSSSQNSSKWLIFVLSCFFVQVIALTFIQGRCVLFDCEKVAGGQFLTPFAIKRAEDVWFMPAQFAAGLVCQTVIFLCEKRKLHKQEIAYGCLSGVSNAISTALLLLATKAALGYEKGLLFPLYAVGTIFLCNVWANRIYKEKFNTLPNALCAGGIFIASL